MLKCVQVGLEILNFKCKIRIQVIIIKYNKRAKQMLHYNGLEIIEICLNDNNGLGNIKM